MKVSSFGFRRPKTFLTMFTFDETRDRLNDLAPYFIETITVYLGIRLSSSVVVLLSNRDLISCLLGISKFSCRFYTILASIFSAL